MLFLRHILTRSWLGLSFSMSMFSSDPSICSHLSSDPIFTARGCSTS